MTDDSSLREILARKEKKLALIEAIDTIRDNSADPTAMFSGIVNLVADEFNADLVLLAVNSRGTKELELKAMSDRGDRYSQIGADAIKQMTQAALKLPTVDIWSAEEVAINWAAKGISDDLQIAAVPITWRDHEPLGVMLVARAASPFTEVDNLLLATVEKHIDSAIVQGHAFYELDLRNREIETIYRVDRIRDQNLPFDDMLNAVLQEIRSAIHAEMGFIMLYDRHGKKLELRAVAHDDMFHISPHHEAVQQVAYESLQKADLVWHNNIGDALRSIMCIPLILHETILGVFGVVNGHGSKGFTDDHHKLLRAIGSQMDTAIFESLEQRRLRQVLGRSVDPRVMQRLLATPEVDFLRTERRQLTVMFADMRNSTELAETVDPDQLVGFINATLGTMADVILEFEGTLDKFIGDGVIALFGAPFQQEDHALRAIRVARQMQLRHREVMMVWEGRGLPRAPLGVGIATGELTIGEMGSPLRTDYTVVGRAANLASRICGVTPGEQVYISQSTYDLVKAQVEVESVPGLSLKGMRDPVTAYHVVDVKP
ncbi:MAG: GAF domain-containing protein [Chloroflexi bacterium]|nr:GAF domain-containing protein [Chloroflexota bacterium]